MFVRETIERCDTCSELTPHSRRAVALPPLIALAFALGATWWCFAVPELAPIGAILFFVAAVVVHRDRRKRWNLPCERCRGKQTTRLRVRREGTGFRLDRNTVTELF